MKIKAKHWRSGMKIKIIIEKNFKLHVSNLHRLHMTHDGSTCYSAQLLRQRQVAVPDDEVINCNYLLLVSPEPYGIGSHMTMLSTCCICFSDRNTSIMRDTGFF